MKILLNLLQSAAIALIASIILHTMSEASSTGLLNPSHFIAIFVSCVLAIFISSALAANSTSPSSKQKPQQQKSASGDQHRERGTVKWFNVSKGYGFVTRGSGEEIFVHFRSIRGSGRKALREGQTIEFSVTQGDKGPQAEDVEPVVT